MTLKEARRRCLPGWNLRCNLCGEHPADWIPDERPGWGCLALCPEHTKELMEEHRRHNEVLRRLRTINFEQLRPREVEEICNAKKTGKKGARNHKNKTHCD